MSCCSLIPCCRIKLCLLSWSLLFGTHCHFTCRSVYIHYAGVFVIVCSGSLYRLCVLIIWLRFSLQSVKHACLCFQGLSVAVGVSQTQVSYLKQQLRNVIIQYLSRFLPAMPTIGAVANHPVLLAGCEATPTPQGAALRSTILQALR